MNTQQQSPPDQIVSPRKFAEVTGLKPCAVYQLFQLGKLEGFQVVKRGNIRIWLNKSLAKLAEANNQGA